MAKMSVLIITQARIGSTRLPNKILKPLNDETILSLHIKRLKKVHLCNKIIVATTFEKGVDQILKIVKESKVFYYQGSTNNVLERFYNAAKTHTPDYIVRVTSDCPLIDAGLIDQVIAFTIDNELDYGSNTLKEHYPDGQDVEVFTFKALKKAYQSAQLETEKEHVTPYIINRSTFKGKNIFTADNFPSKIDYSAVRMTLDEPLDYIALNLLIDELGIDANWEEYAQYLLNNSGKFLNQKIIRNEGYLNSLKKEKDGK